MPHPTATARCLRCRGLLLPDGEREACRCAYPVTEPDTYGLYRQAVELHRALLERWQQLVVHHDPLSRDASRVERARMRAWARVGRRWSAYRSEAA